MSDTEVLPPPYITRNRKNYSGNYIAKPKVRKLMEGDNKEHTVCNKVISDLEQKIQSQLQFIETLLSYNDRSISANEKVARMVHDIEVFLSK